MSVLTKQVLVGIPALVAQGNKPEAIAAQLGCKLSTLKVRCSQDQPFKFIGEINDCATRDNRSMDAVA